MLLVVYFDEILTSTYSDAYPGLQKIGRSFLNRHMLHIVWPCLSAKAIFMPSLDLFLSRQTFKFGLYIHISGGCGINGTNST